MQGENIQLTGNLGLESPVTASLRKRCLGRRTDPVREPRVAGQTKEAAGSKKELYHLLSTNSCQTPGLAHHRFSLGSFSQQLEKTEALSS